MVANVQLALRDHLPVVEGVRDSTLRRELCRLLRERPESILFEVRNEAMMWVLEDQPRHTSVAKNRNQVSDHKDMTLEKRDMTTEVQTDLTVTLQEVVKIIAQHGKAINELTETVRGLTMTNDRPKVQPKYTSDGQPICLRREGVGHMARQCPVTRKPSCQRPTVPDSPIQGKREPPTLVSRTVRGWSEGSGSMLTRERFIERAVGKCPEVEIQIGGVPLRCILDSGSNVSTLTETFFRNRLNGTDEDMHCTAKWLKLTAANNLPLPYLGYVELDVQAMGIVITGCGFLIIQDNTDEASQSLQGIIGMNITSQQLALAQVDTTLGGKLDFAWKEAFQRVEETVGREGFSCSCHKKKQSKSTVFFCCNSLRKGPKGVVQ
ncbi:uncharacterized protein LOC127607116 [Hippocampus zosterae]|uniref:uncharacterized protein LOC127607116 n=1 Tax=Hippocampus zosterae TaxID=109293 RepID=UPI00223D6002|nr:uncharacterized protein LOC127607116 [Hippocampus zosterae]